MSVRITWTPSPEADIASYDIQRAVAIDGPWVDLVNIPHQVPGPNYDNDDSVMFYTDEAGTSAHFYRIITIDDSNQESLPSTPFQVTSNIPSLVATVKVDHNYGTPGALRYQTAGGAPIEGAVIRVFKKADYDQGLTDEALFVSATNAQGNWVAPVYLATGFTYTLHFAKEGLYGPDTREIVV